MVNQAPEEGCLSRATIGSEGSLFIPDKVRFLRPERSCEMRFLHPGRDYGMRFLHSGWGYGTRTLRAGEFFQQSLALAEPRPFASLHVPRQRAFLREKFLRPFARLVVPVRHLQITRVIVERFRRR